jgi:hypothetical protein
MAMSFLNYNAQKIVIGTENGEISLFDFKNFEMMFTFKVSGQSLGELLVLDSNIILSVNIEGLYRINLKSQNVDLLPLSEEFTIQFNCGITPKI